MAALGWLWFAAVVAILVAVSLSDWRHRLVANRAVVALTALALVYLAVGDAAAAAVGSRWWALATAVAATAVGTGAYAAGMVAAGDVKLLLPVALIMTRLDGTAWLIYLAVFIVVGLVVLTTSGRAGKTMPLAPVLGLGVIPALLAAPPPWFG